LISTKKKKERGRKIKGMPAGSGPTYESDPDGIDV
jgi:hypothetical protein